MTDEAKALRQCIEALRAARPFIVDGRGKTADTDRALELLDAALRVANELT